ncbi:1-phosphofructokinase [Stigmatella aurantiaca]|uniref:1-phosphofructokinase n=1 Tax=Stigmatella aurantiaca (strain DW4/3-1) TaxID=378806 RepID=Q08XD5_STIAD|nr:1-phosphofructokinase [Stigmatella aurantiaca]ADO72310.1 1-phosphofructokinase [Stigmatella aurantiaca DW4/3-1]EAU65137.1 1-phosphofructokinase [Stigmatella aurantiaca DW4/3-1]
MARILTLTLNPALDLAIRLGALQLGEVNRTESTRLDAAGKGINVARVLAKLGHEVTVSGLLGADNEQAFVKAFSECGMRDAFIRVPGETRINAKVSEAGGRVTDLNGPGLRIPGHALEALNARVGTLLSGQEAVVISGSLPPNVTPAQLASLITAIRERGVSVWLDTSGPALTSGLAARPTGIKPNENELAGWAGQPLETPEARLQAALRLNAEGIEDVLVSAGSEGVLWAQRGSALEATPPRVAVLSTVGAGDTLLAGTLHGLLSGWPRERTLRFATALAAESVRHVGVGDPKAADFDSLQTQTLVRNPSNGEMHG